MFFFSTLEGLKPILRHLLWYWNCWRYRCNAKYGRCQGPTMWLTEPMVSKNIEALIGNRLFRRRSKKTSKLRVTGLCAGNSPIPALMASNTENVSTWWRHHIYQERESQLSSLSLSWTHRTTPNPSPFRYPKLSRSPEIHRNFSDNLYWPHLANKKYSWNRECLQQLVASDNVFV